MRFMTKFLIDWPESVARHFLWAGPLVARLVVGYVFMLTGWNKLHNLPRMIQNFTEWGIPFPQIARLDRSAVDRRARRTDNRLCLRGKQRRRMNCRELA